MRHIFTATLSASILALAAFTVALDPEAVHKDIIILDTHVDVPLNYMTAEMDPGMDTTAQVDLNKMVAGGLDAAFFIVYTPQTNIAAINDEKYAEARQIAETRYAAIKKLTKKYADRIEL
ncbi:MAG: membrane dipeptidase, partial [Robiginitomaculum sp.]|nr:membrane dipeptidase [Robiginitomaculum sp.]